MLFLLKICIGIANFIYFFFKLLLPVKDKVVMISRQSNEVNSDFRLLGEKLEEQGHQVVYLCKTLDGGVDSGFMTKIKYGLHMFKQMYHLATSKVAVIDSYCPTVSILKQRKSLTVIQIWHSIGTMKSFGYNIFGKAEASDARLARAMHMHRNYTFACTAGEASKKYLALGFDIPIEKMKLFTLPRVDLLMDEEYAKEKREEILRDYPVLSERPNVIYAPTFRKDESGFEKAFQSLVEAFDFEKYNLVVKLHPLSKVSLKEEGDGKAGNAVDVGCDVEAGRAESAGNAGGADNPRLIIDRKYSTFDMIFVGDKMISDYSCVVYEAGVRDMPLYFYNFDMENYDDVRGFDIDYRTLPGYTERDPVKLVEDLDKPYDMEYFREFIHKYVANTKDCAAKLAAEVDRYME